MIPAIVLAAGNSSRMGRPKALLPVDSDGESFLARMIRILIEGGIEDVVVVLGRDADLIRAAVSDPARPVRYVDNPAYEDGQLSSLLAGLAAVERPDVRAVMVTPVDLPLLEAGTVRTVLAAYRAAGGAAIVRPATQGRHGHPVIFDRRLFQALRDADPNVGARSVVQAHLADVVNVDVSDDGAFIDVDTPADYERFVMPRT